MLRRSLRARGVLSTPNCDFLQPPLHMQVQEGLRRAGGAPRRAARWRRRRRSGTRPGRGAAGRRGRRRPAATRGRRPLPSPPRTSTVGPVRSTAQGAASASASAPQIQKPASFASASQSARLRTWATSRCSTAPAEALQVDRGHRRRAALRDHHPGRPGELGRAADRAEVARVLHLVERDDQRVLPAQHPHRVAVGIRIDLGDDPLVVRRPAEPLQLLRRRSPAPARPGARAASPAPPRATGWRP